MSFFNDAQRDGLLTGRTIPYCNGSPNYVGIKNEAYSERTMGNRIR